MDTSDNRGHLDDPDAPDLEPLDAWEWQPEETAAAYAAFAHYRDLTGRRSVLTAWNAARKTQGKPPMKLAGGTHKIWYKEHDWKARAESYDVYIERTARLQREQAHRGELSAFRLRALTTSTQSHTIAIAMLAKMAQRLQTFDPEDVTPALMPGILRATASLLELSLNAEAEAIGVRRLQNLIDDGIAGPQNPL